MNKREFAQMLNGRQYRNEMTEKDEQMAKESGLIVIFGASDDLVEFRGVLYDEMDAWDGQHFIIVLPGTEIPIDEDEETYKKVKEIIAVPIEEYSTVKVNRFEAVWGADDPDCSWLIKTDVPHESFDIMEDDELYCRGVVIDVADLVEIKS